MNAVRLTQFALGFATLVGISFVTNVHANVTLYRIIEGGNTRYVQLQPTGMNCTPMEVDDNNPCKSIVFRNDGRQNTPGQMAPPSVDPNVSAEENRIAELERQMKERDERDKAERCQRLRQNQANLAMGGKLYETQPDGSRTFLSDAQINERRARVEQTIAQHCS